MALNVTRDPRINDDLSNTEQPRHDTDCRAAVQEVSHHLRSDRLGIACNSLCDDAVVSRRYDDHLAADPRSLGGKDAGQLNRKILKPTQAARGFGEIALSGFGVAGMAAASNGSMRCSVWSRVIGSIRGQLNLRMCLCRLKPSAKVVRGIGFRYMLPSRCILGKDRN